MPAKRKTRSTRRSKGKSTPPPLPSDDQVDIPEPTPLFRTNSVVRHEPMSVKNDEDEQADVPESIEDVPTEKELSVHMVTEEEEEEEAKEKDPEPETQTAVEEKEVEPEPSYEVDENGRTNETVMTNDGPQLQTVTDVNAHTSSANEPVKVLQLNYLLAKRLLHFIVSANRLSGLPRNDLDFGNMLGGAIQTYLSEIGQL